MHANFRKINNFHSRHRLRKYFYNKNFQIYGTFSIIIGGINNFVEVNFDSITKTVTCYFPNQSDSMFEDSKQCIANVTYGTDCGQHLGVYRAEGEGSSVVTHTIDFKEEVSSYCLVVSASSSVKTVIVEGNLDLVNTGIIVYVVTVHS